MQKFFAFAAIGCGLLISFSAAAQDGQYVGNSDDRRSGGGGILELNEECAESFGDRARICTSQEIILTFQSLNTVPPIPERDTRAEVRKWVAPSIVAGSSTGIDASGLTAAGSQLTCNGWASISSTFKGLTIDDSGRFSTQACNTTRLVACCKPIQ